MVQKTAARQGVDLHEYGGYPVRRATAGAMTSVTAEAADSSGYAKQSCGHRPGVT